MFVSNRISTKGSYEQVYRGVVDRQKSMLDILAITASPNKLAEVSNLVANGDSRLVANVAKEAHYANSYINSCSIVAMRTELIDHVLDNLLHLSLEMQSTISMHYHLPDMTFLKQSAVAKMAEVQSALNTNLGGFYLFSGSKVDVMPVPELSVADKSAAEAEGCDALLGCDTKYYKGDTFVHSAMLNNEYRLDYGVKADNPAFAKLVTGINLAARAADMDDKGLLRDAQQHVHDAYGDLNNLQQKVRYAYAKAEHYKENHTAMKTRLQELVDKLEDDYHLDLLHLMGSYTEEQAVLESLQHSFVRLSGMNLAKLL